MGGMPIESSSESSQSIVSSSVKPASCSTKIVPRSDDSGCPSRMNTAGTLIGVARQAWLLDKEGHLPRLRQALLADSAAAMLGAALGTSTNTAYIESAADVEEGGRTGLTGSSSRYSFCWRCSSPLAQTVSALCHGTRARVRRLLMAASLGALSWDNPTDYIPALIIVLMMPLSYSIATGIGLGFIAMWH